MTIFKIISKRIVQPHVVKAAFDLEDGNYSLEIKNIDRRSLPQNSLFHAIMPEVQVGLYNAGYRDIKTPEQAKEVVKHIFLKTEYINEISGEKIVTIRPTSSLTKEEMKTLIDEIVQWAAEYLSIEIKLPN